MIGLLIFLNVLNFNSDYINAQKLEQDHPCVLKLIRLLYLDPPSPREVPYNLTMTIPDGDYEAVGDAFHILKRKVRTCLR